MRRALPFLCVLACVRTGHAQPLGVDDKGIFSDLDDRVELAPPKVETARAHAIVDRKHALLVLYRDDFPVKAYPLAGDTTFSFGEVTVKLRAADAAELGPILRGRPVRELAKGAIMPPGDADGDGIPDPLDVLVGAKKVALNGAVYKGGYVEMGYPNGDVPRGEGVCTDVVVRAVRNAGVDLQKALHDDIARAPKAYPMVKHRDANIDQRRVATMVPYFRRHWEKHGTDPKSVDDPFLPGDVVFLDTFPDRPGPDHLGIVSDRFGASGLPLVVNNWTDGFKESEMDLLESVPVLERYRMKVTSPR